MDAQSKIEARIVAHNRKHAGSDYRKKMLVMTLGFGGLAAAVGGFIMMQTNQYGGRGFMLLLASMYAMWRAFKLERSGYKMLSYGNANEAHLEGTKIFRASVLNPALLDSVDSTDIEIGGVAIPREDEQSHFIFAGSVGSGKSVALKRMIAAVRARGTDGAIIHDPVGDLVSSFYDPARGDLIINPLDARHAPWSIWTDMQPGDAAGIARSIVPDVGGDNRFFSDASQTLLEVLFDQTANIDEFICAALGEKDSTLIRRVRSVGMGGMVGSSQTFANVRGNAAPYIKSLALLPNVGASEGFSIREFCEAPRGRFIFLLTSEEKKDLLSPIHQLFLSRVVSLAMSVRPDPGRRTWLFLDEVPNLLPSKSIATAMAQGRKYGLATVLGYQALGQIKKRLGSDEASALLSMPKTRLTLRTSDGETAEAMSKELGDRKIQRKQVSETSGSSKGVASTGTSTSWQTVTERAVLPSTIQKLQDLRGYLRTGGSVIEVALQYRPYLEIAAPYEPVAPRKIPVAPVVAEEDDDDE